MVAEEVYCFIAPDGVSLFYGFFRVFYLLSSSRRLHRLSASLTARDYIRDVMLTVFVMTLAICIICQFAALLPLVTSQTRPRSDVLEPQPSITAGESHMFLALGVQVRYLVDSRGFSDPKDFDGFTEQFSDLRDFSRISDPKDFSGFSDPIDFSGFTDPMDFSGPKDFSYNFGGFGGPEECGDDSIADRNCSFGLNNEPTDEGGNENINGANRVTDNSNVRNNLNSVNNRKSIRVGTWNGRTLAQDGKFEEVEKEMQRMNLNILGLSETRWTGAGKMKVIDGREE